MFIYIIHTHYTYNVKYYLIHFILLQIGDKNVFVILYTIVLLFFQIIGTLL